MDLFVPLAAVVALIAVIFLWSNQFRHKAVFDSVFMRGDGERALAQLEALRRAGKWSMDAECLRIYALRLVFRVDEAADEALARKEDVANGRLTWHQLSLLVDAMVCAGLYEEAMEIEEATPAEQRTKASKTFDDTFALFQLNLSEAEMNLGRADAALARLDRCAKAAATAPLTSSGLAMQRAWILGVLGRGDEAIAAIEGTSSRALGRLYAAEFHLSRAFAFLAAGRIDAADIESREAFNVALRPSSKRNALFVRARVADAQGESALADKLCRAAAEHAHRWQGGDGLLFWGDLQERNGAHEGARDAWRLAIERDPQSVSAATAKSRLEPRAIL